MRFKHVQCGFCPCERWPSCITPRGGGCQDAICARDLTFLGSPVVALYLDSYSLHSPSNLQPLSLRKISYDGSRFSPQHGSGRVFPGSGGTRDGAEHERARGR